MEDNSGQGLRNELRGVVDYQAPGNQKIDTDPVCNNLAVLHNILMKVRKEGETAPIIPKIDPEVLQKGSHLHEFLPGVWYIPSYRL